MTIEKTSDENTLKAQVKELIREVSKGEKRGWLGVAPSYLCAEFDLGYEEACSVLLDLQQEGFIYDNKNGNYRTLEDGRKCATRFFMTRFEPRQTAVRDNHDDALQG